MTDLPHLKLKNHQRLPNTLPHRHHDTLRTLRRRCLIDFHSFGPATSKCDPVYFKNTSSRLGPRSSISPTTTPRALKSSRTPAITSAGFASFTSTTDDSGNDTTAPGTTENTSRNTASDATGGRNTNRTVPTPMVSFSAAGDPTADNRPRSMIPTCVHNASASSI